MNLLASKIPEELKNVITLEKPRKYLISCHFLKDTADFLFKLQCNCEHSNRLAR